MTCSVFSNESNVETSYMAFPHYLKFEDKQVTVYFSPMVIYFTLVAMCENLTFAWMQYATQTNTLSVSHAHPIILIGGKISAIFT